MINKEENEGILPSAIDTALLRYRIDKCSVREPILAMINCHDKDVTKKDKILMQILKTNWNNWTDTRQNLNANINHNQDQNQVMQILPQSRPKTKSIKACYSKAIFWGFVGSYKTDIQTYIFKISVDTSL